VTGNASFALTQSTVNADVDNIHHDRGARPTDMSQAPDRSYRCPAPRATYVSARKVSGGDHLGNHRVAALTKRRSRARGHPPLAGRQNGGRGPDPDLGGLISATINNGSVELNRGAAEAFALDWTRSIDTSTATERSPGI
jgi:hypothetical protein